MNTTKYLRPINFLSTAGVLAAATAIVLSTGIAAPAADVTAADVTAARSGPANAEHAGGVKPTIVFVHGAWADANGFAAEIGYFSHRGYPVVTVANPLRGPIGDGNYLRDRLKTIDGPIVIAAHSYGGAVMTNGATGVPNVKALVFLGAFAPDEGETLATVVPASKFPGSHLGPDKLNTVPVANPFAPGGKDVDLYIKPKDFADIFAGDVSKQNAALQAATQRPLANNAYTQASGAPAWKTIPSWDLITLNDHAIPPAGQRYMAQRMGAHIETVRSAHDVMISHPRAVESIVLQAANSVR